MSKHTSSPFISYNNIFFLAYHVNCYIKNTEKQEMACCFFFLSFSLAKNKEKTKKK